MYIYNKHLEGKKAIITKLFNFNNILCSYNVNSVVCGDQNINVRVELKYFCKESLRIELANKT